MLCDMLDIPQQNPLKYGFGRIEVLLSQHVDRSNVFTILSNIKVVQSLVIHT